MVFDLNYKVVGRYVGGVIYWMFDGDELRRTYIVDISPALVTDGGLLEIPVALTNIDTLDPDYDGEYETIGVQVKAFPLKTPEEILQLVKESKPLMCHITNVSWNMYESWSFLKARETMGMHFHDFKKGELKDALQKATDITIMFEMINTGELTIDNLEDYLKKHNILGEIWYVDLDLRGYYDLNA